MKKLLVLMLVLGMSSVASATITVVAPTQLDYTVSETGIISVSSDSTADAGIYLDIYYVSDASYSLANPTLTSIAPSLSTVNWYKAGYDNDELEILFASAPDEVVTTGEWFTLEITCLAGIDVLVEVYDSAAPYPLLQTMTIEQIPEPMTIALLGLGGLFMLRRRK
jgi:hypothetical protein